MKTFDEIKQALAGCKPGRCAPDCPYWDRIGCVQELHRDTLAMVQQLEAQVPKWTSVKKRLPGTYSTVLVAYKDAYGETSVGAGILCNCADWVGHGFAMARDAVTHWMPLPGLPEDD